MNSGVNVNDPAVVAAFRAALLHQGVIALLIFGVLGLAWVAVRAWMPLAGTGDGAGAQAAGTRTAVPVEPAGRQLLRVGFGLLWIFDGILQAQPKMAVGLPSQVIEPIAASSPRTAALGLARGNLRFRGALEGGGKQVAGGQAPVGPPFLGHGEDLLFGGEVVELVGSPDGLAEREVARQDDVFSLERDDEGALHGPRAYPRYRGELCHKRVVWQVVQHGLIQPAVRQPLGEVAQRADLPPGEPGLAEFGGIHAQQLGGSREVAAEQRLDTGKCPAGRPDRQLLPGDLEQQGTVQIHRRKLGQPRPRIEGRPAVDKPCQHGVGAAKVRARSL
jgi:hypothetical protein